MKLIYITVPIGDLAEELAQMLVKERLAACVNTFSAGQSYFEWEGQVQFEAEVVIIAKTSDSKAKALIERVHEAHPYECPAILQLPVDGGHGPFLSWVEEQTK